MKCLDEGTLQAYLDSELAERRMSRATGHLEACATCRDRLGRIEAAAGRVNAWLDALAPEDLPAVYEGVPRIAARTGSLRWRWAAVGLAGALAASVALFFANAPVPRKEARVQRVEGPLANARGSVSVVPHRVATVRKRMRRPMPQPALDDFVPFDDADPMQIGMVVRVMLPVSDATEIAADLVIGEDGRARAFRFVR
jgi:anti-sigma factor RsiW